MGRKSRSQTQTNGLAQGSVLASILLNLYKNDQPTPTFTKNFIYADDLRVTVQGLKRWTKMGSRSEFDQEKSSGLRFPPSAMTGKNETQHHWINITLEYTENQHPSEELHKTAL